MIVLKRSLLMLVTGAGKAVVVAVKVSVSSMFSVLLRKGNTVIYNSAILAGRQSWKHARGLLKDRLQ